MMVIRFDVTNEEYREISIPQSIVCNETLQIRRMPQGDGGMENEGLQCQ